MALFEIQSVLHTKNTLHFKWSDLGGTYLIYRDHTLLYEGLVASFQDEQLKEGQIYNYLIERVVQGVVVDVIRLQTSTYPDAQQSENPFDSLVMTVAVSRKQVVLFWEKVAEVERYEIYKDDVLLKESDKNYYIDIHPTFNGISTYRIQSTRPVLKSKGRFTNSKMLIANVLGMTTSWGVQPAIETFTIVKEVGPVQELLRPMAKQKKVEVNKWKFRYTTFIREEVVKNPNILSKNRTFGGDGRGFDPTGSGYRTRVDASLDCHEQQSPVVCKKLVGESVAYDRLGNVREVAVADSDGIVIESNNDEPKKLGLSIKHDVGNPLVQSPALNYETFAFFQQDGLVDVTGFHNQAPHHEVYIKKDEGAWKAIHLAESKGLFWLFDFTSWNYWRYSNMQ